jgi:hypothetical protein
MGKIGLVYPEGDGGLAFGQQCIWIRVLLFSAGLVTTLPLIWFIGRIATAKIP